MYETSTIPMVNLTLVNAEKSQTSDLIAVPASGLLAYEQRNGFTRVRLTKGGWLDVREATDEIDRRLRWAATQMTSVESSPNPCQP
jgi:hypothetical protein